ncbi:hypothetical protein A6U98_14655 [Rhizobium sp. WYCCWR10014]|uniref:hypothetical protein n=1 Tax=Rhizobium sp. WYCCWR10014 TaxID=1825933 RepID=UPI0007E40463|nr:hypothetical protein [Rhizobium sp. WYCCWR10014]OAV49884.1 hypothetical protein A6U98_14655 [Rhizobium sp. WYCCWR10014]
MPIDKRKFMDWNLNTLLGGVTLISMIAGGAIAWNNYQRDIGELQAWRAQAQAESKELSGRVGKIEGVVDNLGFRVTIGEQSAAATAGAHQRSAVDAQRAGRFHAP